MQKLFILSIFTILPIIFLASCSKTSTPTPGVSNASGSTGVTKTPYQISTLKMSDIQERVRVEKTARITASSNLTLTSQWAGEIGKILIKEWQSIKAGSTIAVLKDTVNNFDLRLAQAENTLNIQDTSITTSQVNLAQGVDNARIGLDRATQASATLNDKNAIQYDTLVNANGKTLDAYNQNYKTYLTDTDRLMTQLLFEADKILGVTSLNEYANDNWEAYLGIRNGTSFADAKNEWNTLYTVRGIIRAKLEKNMYIDPDRVSTDVELVGSGYTELQRFTDAMILMIQNNVVWAGLGQDLQNGWILAWNGYKSQTQWAEAGYNAWKSQTVTFFKWYKNSELATKLALMSLTRTLTPAESAMINGSTDIKVTYESSRIDLKDRIENAKLATEQAKLTYDNAIRIRDATIAQLDATRKNAQISLDQARRDYSKLSISAPVDGTITKMIANVGQTINVGTPIAEFAGKLPQIVIDVDSSLASGLMIGDSVSVTLETISLTGTITAVSRVSNANLLSTVRISIVNGEKYIGKSARITFISNAKNTDGKILLPINAVKIISEEEGEIYILSESGSLKKKSVKLGSVGDTNIEVFTTVGKNDSIITTDMSNYDESKNILTPQ